MKRPVQILLSGAIALVALHSSQAAVMLTANSGWERLKWTTAGAAGAIGSGVDANNRVLAWPQSATFRIGDSNDVFSFSVPVGSRGWIDVTDIEANDDGYAILDFNDNLSTIGSVVGPGGDPTSMVDDPVVTFADANWGSGSFEVLSSGAGGTVDFKVERNLGSQVNSGGVFVQVRTEVIPEPSSSALMLLGLLGLVTRRRRA